MGGRRDENVDSGDHATVTHSVVAARDVDAALARALAVLLGRAYTDERHVAGYSDDERARLLPHVERVQARGGELMPADYLENFPTVRNLSRPASRRREAFHVVSRDGERVNSHVSLWAQYFVFEGTRVAGGYIEDVATDPSVLGKGLASEGMRAAESMARDLGLDLLGLATGIEAFYERLGWRTWRGSHTFEVADFGLAYADEPCMLLPLTAAGEKLARAGGGDLRSWRLWWFV